MRNPLNRDRWNMEDTPESDEERECIRTAAIEREIDRADYLRDEMRDRQWEEAMERSERNADVDARPALFSVARSTPTKTNYGQTNNQ